ncbi:helix-turn-helix domain-containing protein [Cohnella herbarum]|uniref:helix-turn-helix domain-containing protein n=1 Tax=Cohnella herbarum TaxID=2728023 RepID=UPI0035BED6AC
MGQNLANLRNESNRTQIELSEILIVTHQAISKWERGESLPNIESLLTLGKLYNKSIDDLLSCGLRSVEPHKPFEPLAPLSNLEIDATEIWTQSLQLIRTKMSKPSFDTWFKETSAVFDGDSIIIYSPTSFANEWLYTRYSSMIIETINEITGNTNLNICFKSLNLVEPTSKLKEQAILIED